MFERAHHQHIAKILRSLDAPMLLDAGCLFGGGTAISLSHGEYRESVDIDFVCSSAAGYRAIRERLDVLDPSWLFRHAVQVVREPRVDQYGIRLAAAVDGAPVKIEIIFEGRVPLADPLPQDRIEGVWVMAEEDLVATKLMANADRYADDQVMSRDIIDLAMMTSDGDLSPEGVHKARSAYGQSIDKALHRAKDLLRNREGRLARCMTAMKMEMPHDELRDRIERLALGPIAPRRQDIPR